jgi:hypothetical protein
MTCTVNYPNIWTGARLYLAEDHHLFAKVHHLLREEECNFTRKRFNVKNFVTEFKYFLCSGMVVSPPKR